MILLLSVNSIIVPGSWWYSDSADHIEFAAFPNLSRCNVSMISDYIPTFPVHQDSRLGWQFLKTPLCPVVGHSKDARARCLSFWFESVCWTLFLAHEQSYHFLPLSCPHARHRAIAFPSEWPRLFSVHSDADPNPWCSTDSWPLCENIHRIGQVERLWTIDLDIHPYGY